MEPCPGERVVKEEKFPHNRKPSHRHICAELWNLRGQYNWGENTHTHTHTHTHRKREYSHVWFFATPWTIQSMDFPGQNTEVGNWSGYPLPSPEDLPNLGSKPRSPILQADSLPAEPPSKPTEYTPNHNLPTSREVAQMLVSATSEWGLSREVWAVSSLG